MAEKQLYCCYSLKLRNYLSGKEKYELRKRYDEIKREYAISHGYSFLEIPYTQMDNINQILSKSLLKG